MLGLNDDITSPLSAQIFDFCDPQQFEETFNQSSEVNSVSNILDKSGSFQDTNTTTTTENSNTNMNNIFQDDEDDNNNADLSIVFDSRDDFENDIAASIDFSSSPLQYPLIDQLLTTTNQDQFDFSSGAQIVHQLPNIPHSGDNLALPAVSSIAPPLLPLGVFEEDCLSSVPSYNLGLNPNPCSFFRTSGLPAYMSTGLLSSDNSSGLYPGHIHLGPDFNKPRDQLMDFQTDNGGLFCPDSIKGIFNPGDLQYACRKTLADSRPRVRGRFAKNDEFGELTKQGSSSHYDDEDGVGLKDEEQLVDSSDIFAHISGPNSFKCNYSIQSWI
ncbi:hypothetical protein YC2023_055222 [Brassica napus]